MFRTREQTLLERLMERTFRELDNHPVGSQDYNATLEAAIKLHKMREEEKSHRVSKDTLLVVGANILGIILVINHEYAHPIITRAMGLVLTPRYKA
jgi:hypothetical protein